MGLLHIIAEMMGAGVFEHDPNLRVSFGESGAGWLVYALHRMDFEFEDPHTDGIWPESSKYIEEQFAGLSPEIVHKITCENAAKFYGLIN
jgi:hypothetical protein